LELTVLACALRIMGAKAKRAPRPGHPEASKDAEPFDVVQNRRVEGLDAKTSLQFLTENTDTTTRLYRASDETGLELLAAFLPDGRVRIADTSAHRFAGMIENGRADLLDIANNEWSELFLHQNPNGETQFELRGGPYDARVLTCRPYVLRQAQDDEIIAK
jgi:hypothetical protein